MALQRSLFPWFLFCSFSVGVRSDIIGVCSFCQALKVRNTSVTTTMLHFIQLWDRQEPLWCKEWSNVWNANMCYYFWDTVQDFLLPLGGRNLKATGKKVGRFWRAFLSPMGNFSGSISWDSTDNPLPEGALNLPPPALHYPWMNNHGQNRSFHMKISNKNCQLPWRIPCFTFGRQNQRGSGGQLDHNPSTIRGILPIFF